MNSVLDFFSHEVRLRLRGSAGPAALGLFILAGTLTPLSIGTEATLLQSVAAGFVWVFASLAALLGLDGLFQEDLEEGRFLVLRLSALPLWLIMLVMMSAYWLVVCAPVIVAAVPVGFLFGMDPAAISRLVLSLVLGTPFLAFIGTCVAAICAGLQRGTGLVIFLALPFFATPLIFGARAAGGGEFAAPSFLLLAALSLGAIALCPIAAAFAMKGNME